MGLSGWILTRERITDYDDFKDDIMKILERFPCDCVADKHGDVYFISIVDNNEEYVVAMQIDDSDTPEDIPVCDGQDYYCAIYIEKISGTERLNMLLEFMYYYLKLYPEHIFFHYGGIEWFYTKSDIDTIYESGNWEYWCFIKPPKK